MLTKKQDYLEKRIEQELMIAKKNGTKNKRGEFLVSVWKEACLCTCTSLVNILKALKLRMVYLW